VRNGAVRTTVDVDVLLLEEDRERAGISAPGLTALAID
jgi:hypothetical protein